MCNITHITLPQNPCNNLTTFPRTRRAHLHLNLAHLKETSIAFTHAHSLPRNTPHGDHGATSRLGQSHHATVSAVAHRQYTCTDRYTCHYLPAANHRAAHLRSSIKEAWHRRQDVPVRTWLVLQVQTGWSDPLQSRAVSPAQVDFATGIGRAV